MLVINQKVYRRAKAIWAGGELQKEIMANKTDNKNTVVTALETALEIVLNEMVETRPLPIVNFDYRNTKTGEVKQRWLRLDEMNDSYIKGFEIDGANDDEPGKYKTFRVDRVRSVVEIVSFLK